MTREEVLDEVNVIYERVSNNENNLFSDGKYTEALEVLIDYYEVGFIEELESLKSITQVMKENSKYDNQPFDLFLSLLDSRISELKGEQE